MKLARITNVQEEPFDMIGSILQSAEDLSLMNDAIYEIENISHTLEMYELITDTIKARGGVSKSLEIMFGENFTSAHSMEAEANNEKEIWTVRLWEWIKNLWKRFWTWLKGLFGFHDKEEKSDEAFVKKLEALPENAEVEITVEPEVVEQALLVYEAAIDTIEEEVTQVEKQAQMLQEKVDDVKSIVKEESRKNMEVLEKKCEELKEAAAQDNPAGNAARVEVRQTAHKMGKKSATDLTLKCNRVRAKKNSAMKKICDKVGKSVLLDEIKKSEAEGKISSEVSKIMQDNVNYVVKNAQKLEKGGKVFKPDTFMRVVGGNSVLVDDINDNIEKAQSVDEVRAQVIRGLKQKGYTFKKINLELVANAEKFATGKGWEFYQTDGQPYSKSPEYQKVEKKKKLDKLADALRKYFCKEDVMHMIEVASKMDFKR